MKQPPELQLRTYQARSMTDALAKVKRDLGREAVILHTRTLRRGGVLGIGARSVIEITATADSRVTAIRRSPGGSLPASPRPGLLSGTPAVSRDVQLAAESPAPGRTAMPEQVRAPVPAASPIPDLAMMRELREVREMVAGLLAREENAQGIAVPAELTEHYTRLIQQQVADELAREVCQRVAKALPPRYPFDATGAIPRKRVEEELLKCIAALLPPVAPLEPVAVGRPTIAAFVGPTGVGKTTTLAKLAANMRIRESRRVGLITIDTFRIAAVEQLRTYAEILRIPLVSVARPEEMAAAIQSMPDVDVILIDTAGRSQRDEPRLAELATFLEVSRPHQIHLVLSGTSSEEASRQAIEKFSPLGVGHVIFTKLDEAVGLGIILNLLKGINLRLSYMTHGQSVPDDISAASGTAVARMILGLPALQPGASA